MNGGIMLYNAAGSLESEGLPEKFGELYVSRHYVATRTDPLVEFLHPPTNDQPNVTLLAFRGSNQVVRLQNSSPKGFSS